MEHFGIQIGQICHYKYEYWLNNANIVREACNEASEKTPYHTCKGKKKVFNDTKYEILSI